MTELIAVALFTILAVISPGADFAMVTRSSYAQGRKAGLAAAVGIALGVQVHVLYTVLGIAVIISQSPSLFLFMKVVGAGYLIYLGYKSLTNTTRIRLDGIGQDTGASLWAALRTGFLTNALNPKTMRLRRVHVVCPLGVVQFGGGVLLQHGVAQGDDRAASHDGPSDWPGADRPWSGSCNGECALTGQGGHLVFLSVVAM